MFLLFFSFFFILLHSSSFFFFFLLSFFFLLTSSYFFFFLINYYYHHHFSSFFFFCFFLLFPFSLLLLSFPFLSPFFHPFFPPPLSTLSFHPFFPPFLSTLSFHPFLSTLSFHPFFPPFLSTLSFHPFFPHLLSLYHMSHSSTHRMCTRSVTRISTRTVTQPSPSERAVVHFAPPPLAPCVPSLPFVSRWRPTSRLRALCSLCLQHPTCPLTMRFGTGCSICLRTAELDSATVTGKHVEEEEATISPAVYFSRVLLLPWVWRQATTATNDANSAVRLSSSVRFCCLRFFLGLWWADSDVHALSVVGCVTALVCGSELFLESMKTYCVYTTLNTYVERDLLLTRILCHCWLDSGYSSDESPRRLLFRIMIRPSVGSASRLTVWRSTCCGAPGQKHQHCCRQTLHCAEVLSLRSGARIRVHRRIHHHCSS